MQAVTLIEASVSHESGTSMSSSAADECMRLPVAGYLAARQDEKVEVGCVGTGLAARLGTARRFSMWEGMTSRNKNLSQSSSQVPVLHRQKPEKAVCNEAVRHCGKDEAGWIYVQRLGEDDRDKFDEKQVV